MLRNVLNRFGLAPLFLLMVAFNAGADVLSFDFSSQPPNTRFLDPSGPGVRPEPRIEGGILKLTDANDPGNNAGFAIGPFSTTTINALQATWKSRLGGGGGGGADGYSLSIGTDLSDTFPQGEEGTGTGLSVGVDTFDNGVALDPAGTGLEIRWGGTVIASKHVNKDNAGDGVFLRKDTFVDAAVSVSPNGLVSFVYDGVSVSAQIPAFAGIAANQYMFTARTGGANDNQWIDDLKIVTQTPDTQLIAPAGSSWVFNDATATPGLDGTGWQMPAYDTSSVPGWRTGTALFGNDAAGIYDGANQPFAGLGTNGFQTQLDRFLSADDTGNADRITFYFRTTFNWSGPTAGVTLTASNWVDDGIIAYLNGVEVSRIRIAAGPTTWDTLGSNPGTEGLVEVVNWDASALVEGQNTLAVELHQSGGNSSDAAFALGLTARAPIPPTIVNSIEPTNRTIFANRSTTFTVEAIGSPAVTYQWYKDGSPIDPTANATATSSSLVIPNAQAGDEGSYFARVSSSSGSVDSRTATLTVLPAVPLKVVRASGSIDLTHVTVVYDQFVDHDSAVDVFNYSVAGFGILPPIVLNSDGQSVVLTLDAAQSPNANYCVTVQGVLSGAGLPLDPDPTTVCYNSFVVSCGFAVQENYNGIGGVLLTDLEASSKYPGSPDLVRYRTFAGINTADEFDNYGARLTGWLIPPVSGNYTFYLATDDQGDLWLSTDSSPANLVKIADEPVWSGRRTWTGEGGGGGRLATPSVSGGPQANISGPIALVAGQMYYFQARMKEGGGGDNLDVAWQKPGDPVPLNGSPSIPGVYLASLADPANASLTIGTQPQNQNVVLGVGSRALVSQDFNSGDGGFTVSNEGAPANPWSYDAAAGSWSCYHTDPCGPGQNASRLISPSFTVTRSGAVSATLIHRYSFEPDQWDGGQLLVSVNGGPFTTVPASAFAEGGYTATAFIGNHQLQGQAGWNANSPNYAGGVNITSRANLGSFNAGDTVRIQLIGAWDECTTVGNPSWLVDAVTLTEGIAAQQTANFTVAASAVVGGSPSSAIFYQWERNCGSGYALVAGANSATYSFEPRLADNGCKFRVRMYVPGATAVSSEALLTVVQPNTPPTFTCGPAPAAVECGGAGQFTVLNWATDIQVHSISRTPIVYGGDFTALPAGSVLGGNAALAGGVLHLTDAINSQTSSFLTPAVPGAINSFTVNFKLLLGGGTCCGSPLPGGNGVTRPADGMSITIGDVQVPVSFPVAAEEGAALGGGGGVVVAFDTWDNNGTDEAPAVDVKIGGNVIAFQSLDGGEREGGRPPAGPFVTDPATGQPLSFQTGNQFVDVRIHLDSDGTLDVDFRGVRVIDNVQTGIGNLSNARVAIGGRTGGANNNQWIDDLQITALPVDASAAESGQTVHFIVSNDNPSLFSAQPAVSPSGTLSYALAPGAVGSANVTVVAQDDGGTANGGRDTSTPCTFVVSVGDSHPPTATCPGNVTADATSQAGAVVNYTASGSDSCGLASFACVPPSGSTFPIGTTTVTCTAVDRAGNRAACTFTVTVNHVVVTPPVAVISSEQLIDLKPEYDVPVLLSCNWWNACLVADGYSSSSTPPSAPLTYLWSLNQDPVPFGAGPVVTNCLEVGRHTIHLTVTDPAGLSGTDSKTIEVVTAPLAIELLIEQIEESHKSGVVLSRKTKRELTETLRVALAHAGREELRATQKALDAFEKKVRAQVAPTEPEAATAWIRWSQAISDGMEKCIKPPRKGKDHHDDKKDDDRDDKKK